MKSLRQSIHKMKSLTIFLWATLYDAADTIFEVWYGPTENQAN